MNTSDPSRRFRNAHLPDRCDVYLHAPVRGEAVMQSLAGELWAIDYRIRLATTFSADQVAVHTMADQVVAHRIGALEREIVVVGPVTDAIGVTDQAHRVDPPYVTQFSDQLIQLIAATVGQAADVGFA